MDLSMLLAATLACGAVATEAQTLVWFATILIGVAILGGPFLRWQGMDQTVAVGVPAGIAWLLARTRGSA